MMNWLTFWRRLLQIAVIALFCTLPWLNARGFNEISGSLFAFDFFGIPFADPASALQTAAGGMNVERALEPTLFIGAAIALLVALCLGRVFCGWLCPYGFFSELLNAITGKLGLMRHLNEAFIAKTALLTVGVACTAVFAYPLISIISFPGELSLYPLELWLHHAWPALLPVIVLPLLALIFELVFGSRLWCKYCCPQSVLLGACAWLLPRQLPGLRIGFDAKNCHCGKNSPCANACSLNLNPRQKNGPPRRDCVMCGECVDACAKHGHALNFRIGKN